MKKLFFWFIFISSFSFTQTWIDQGATWVYSFDTPASPIIGAKKYEYVNDTTIQGQNCQMIVSTTNTFSSGMGGNYYLTNVMIDTNYTYSNGDTIFWYDNGHFFVYLNFDANIGDQWVVTNRESFTGPSNCDSLSKVVVADKGFEFVNGHQVKYVKLVTLSNSGWGLHGVYTNKFGFWRNEFFDPLSYKSIGSLFPHINDVSCWNQGVIYEWPRYRLHCYWDSTFGTYNQLGGWCEEHFYLSDSEISVNEKAIVFPNPSKGYLNIVDNTFAGLKYEIYDLTGQEVAFGKLKGSQIDIRFLESGCYLLNLFNNGELVLSERIILNH